MRIVVSEKPAKARKHAVGAVSSQKSMVMKVQGFLANLSMRFNQLYKRTDPSRHDQVTTIGHLV